MTLLADRVVVDLRWVDVCAFDDLLPERGACALVNGEQVAIFRMFDGTLHALGNHDPFSGANVIWRWIVGCAAGRRKVVSPIYKQAFDLETGVCLDDPS